MSTSAIEGRRGRLLQAAFAYLAISLFCALLGGVYEHFGHGVYSFFMRYAFAFPLAGGALPLMALALFARCRFPGRLALNLYNSGIAALTVGSLLKGALDIYGTTNALIPVYWIAGAAFVAAGGLAYAIEKSAGRNRRR